jgi:ribosomal protein S30
MYVSFRKLCLEAWRGENPGLDEKKFENYWRRRINKEEKDVRVSYASSHLV